MPFFGDMFFRTMSMFLGLPYHEQTTGENAIKPINISSDPTASRNGYDGMDGRDM